MPNHCASLFTICHLVEDKPHVVRSILLRLLLVPFDCFPANERWILSSKILVNSIFAELRHDLLDWINWVPLSFFPQITHNVLCSPRSGSLQTIHRLGPILRVLLNQDSVQSTEHALDCVHDAGDLLKALQGVVLKLGTKSLRFTHLSNKDHLALLVETHEGCPTPTIQLRPGAATAVFAIAHTLDITCWPGCHPVVVDLLRVSTGEGELWGLIPRIWREERFLELLHEKALYAPLRANQLPFLLDVL
mmetsp:Transcript_43300/g.68601  ORF Transcript_43300/g.68601 Transcript_43300/m.68601 type:complete len:248 (-) Transcript_43300:251-994(-)